MGVDGSYPAWSHSYEETAAYHKVDLQQGLTKKDVGSRRLEHGYNELEKQPGKPLWQLVLEQFDDMLVKVRVVVAGTSSFITGCQSFHCTCRFLNDLLCA